MDNIYNTFLIKVHYKINKYLIILLTEILLCKKNKTFTKFEDFI